MNRIIHNPDISHCPGARQALCTRCLRALLLKVWKKLPSEQQRPILVMPARFSGVTCPHFFDVQRVDPDFYRRNSH